jgi:hypothetical protein
MHGVQSDSPQLEMCQGLTGGDGATGGGSTEDSPAYIDIDFTPIVSVLEDMTLKIVDINAQFGLLNVKIDTLNQNFEGEIVFDDLIAKLEELKKAVRDLGFIDAIIDFGGFKVHLVGKALRK